MKRFTLTIWMLLATIFVAYSQDRKLSEWSQKYRLGLSDRIAIVSTNGNNGFTNFTINGADLLASLGGVITNNTGTLSNSVTANITNLLAVTIVTNYLDTAGDSVRFLSSGVFNGNANAKSVFVALGGTILFQSTNIFPTASGTNHWAVEGELIRLTAASYIASTRFICLGGSAIAGSGTNYSASFTTIGAESLATNNTLAIQTRAIAAGDNTNTFLQLRNYPVLQQ